MKELQNQILRRTLDCQVHKQILVQYENKRVLLVEDNPINCQAATEYLTQMGLTVDLAENGKIGVEKVFTHPYDLVFMDLHMPEMDGLTATQEIRNHHDGETLPIIAMTADAVSGSVEESLSVGMNGHIAKPLNLDSLKQVLIQWLGAPNAAAHGVSTISVQEGQDKDFYLSKLQNSSVFQLDQALEELNHDYTFWSKLLGIFFTSHKDIEQKIKELLKTKECHVELHRIAHSLKSSARYIGAHT